MKDPGASQFYRDFRARLKELREDKLDLTQDEMAEALNLPKASYPKYETRDRFPLHRLQQLALVTREDIEYLLTGKKAKASRFKLVR